MAVIAAIQTTALSPQVGAQVVAIGVGNNIRPAPLSLGVVGAPTITAGGPPAPRSTGHAIG